MIYFYLFNSYHEYPLCPKVILFWKTNFVLIEKCCINYNYYVSYYLNQLNTMCILQLIAQFVHYFVQFESFDLLLAWIENSLQATRHVPGQQEDDITIYAPGHWFGETVFEKDRVVW